MKLSKTWSARLQHGGQLARKAALAVLTGLAVLGGMAGCKVFLAPDHPDFAAIAQRVHNEQDQVGAFAADFVVSWLTATTTCQGQPAADQGAAAVADTSCRDRDAAVLQRFITTPDGSAMTLPQTPAAVVTIPQVVSVISAGSVGDADLYTAVVAANERPYASAQPTRSFYQVPVSVWHYQPRALAMPARINGPGPGADIKLGYRQPVSTESPIYAVVTGFVRTYLTSTTGLDRYVVAGTPLVGVGGYQSAIVTAASSTETIPDQPASGSEIHVLATVLAQTSQFATVNMIYPLRVENSGGTWMISGLDLMPHIAGSQPTAVSPRNP